MYWISKWIIHLIRLNRNAIQIHLNQFNLFRFTNLYKPSPSIIHRNASTPAHSGIFDDVADSHGLLPVLHCPDWVYLHRLLPQIRVEADVDCLKVLYIVHSEMLFGSRWL